MRQYFHGTVSAAQSQNYIRARIKECALYFRGLGEIPRDRGAKSRIYNSKPYPTEIARGARMLPARFYKPRGRYNVCGKRLSERLHSVVYLE
jgi:hypothetical protein